ncbi:tripartite motif-containing protein 29-like [Megalobrama amblycephala]|uniref:tripartite motif-containing protein 29-like n=1 Tax=Megalobrama amblycephala TaxID=75352 RepID=UPI0020142313|nr:tripartite motif-containing protein 29-like [Megalobrama amblycephala]
MAEASISEAEDQFSCPVCLDLLKDPVTIISCGHSYCMSCVTHHWNQQDHNAVYSCPMCKRTFTPRPALYKNVVFAKMVEKLKMTKVKITLNYAGPGDVECDVCTGRKYKAVKSCLQCLESYCQIHFERHEAFRTGKRHKITDATGRLQGMICSKHDKQLEIYCRTDQRCICYLCTMDEHRNHDTVTAVAERTEKQKSLEERQRKVQQIMQETEKRIQELKDAVKTHKHSAQTAVEDSERIFTELIHYIEKSRSEVTQMIRDEEKAKVSRAEKVLEELERDISDLRRREAELEQLSHTDNHILFLQGFKSLPSPSTSSDFSGITDCSFSFDDVGKSVSQLKEKLEGLCKEEVEKLTDRAKQQVMPLSEHLSPFDEKSLLSLSTLNQQHPVRSKSISRALRELQKYKETP